MLQRIGGKHARHARVKAAAKKRRDAGICKAFLICPLPGIIEVRGKARLLAALLINCTPRRIVGIFRFVVRGIDVVHLACQAGIHNRQILVRQRHI